MVSEIYNYLNQSNNHSSVEIYKGGTGTDVKGFRPVAILSTIAKVFKSVIQRSLQEQVASQLSSELYEGYYEGTIRAAVCGIRRLHIAVLLHEFGCEPRE